MNVPATIKGFTAVAPDFPQIVGLPLYPFANALFSALTERASIAGRSFSLSYPYPATGRGFCNVQEHKLEHFLILEDFDSRLNSICQYYVNQYALDNQRSTPQKWTFSDLLSKALELLGMTENEGIDRLGSGNYGRTIAYWGIQRAVMVSLLVLIYSESSRYGKYVIKRKHADTGWNSRLGFSDSYSKAVAGASEQQREQTTIGSIPFTDYANFTYSENSHGGPYMCSMSNVLEAKFVPSSNFEFLLGCPCRLYVNVHYSTTGASTYIFDSFGTGFVEGINNIPISLGSDGVFFSNSYPKYPSGYEEAKYGWEGNGALIFDMSGGMQYGMTWGDGG